MLQLGGSDPAQMRAAAALARRLGFRQINLNCGCPSDRVVGRGCFGAALMRNAGLVRELTVCIADSGASPSVKCRLGIDECDSYEFIRDFVAQTSLNGCNR